MADKLYFMIRDLYAMHSNYMRQKQASLKNTQNEHWQQHQQQRMVATESSVRQQQWSTPPTNNLQQQQQQQAGIQQGVPGQIPSGFSPFPASSPIEEMPFRGVSLADIAQSTSDGASRTNWFLGADNTKNIAASMQALGRVPNPNIFQMTTDNNNAPFSTNNTIGDQQQQPWLYDFSANAPSPTTATDTTTATTTSAVVPSTNNNINNSNNTRLPPP